MTSTTTNMPKLTARRRLAVPTIHLNGTSKDALIDGWCNAVHALHEAGRALAQTAPNGRDFYTQGNGALSVAMDQHDARMNKLREIIQELEQTAQEATKND